MNPDPKLDRLLKEWEPRLELPSRFEPEVWRRIALSQERSAGRNWNWAFRFFDNPKSVFATVALTMALGIGIAVWQAESNYDRQMEVAHARYIHSVDPFASVALVSN